VGGLADFGVAAYGDPLEEARHCRQHCALFDFSFMARGKLQGPGALGCLQGFQSRDLGAMRQGQIRYSLLTDSAAAVVADLTVWKISSDRYDIYLGKREDMLTIKEHIPSTAVFADLSENTRVFSLQGPASLSVLSRLTDGRRLRSLEYFQQDSFEVAGTHCQIGRLGYTGEKGFEIVVDNPVDGDKVWSMLAELAAPAGMIAADILRIEAGFILFLNECRAGCTARELGLGQFCLSGRGNPAYRLVCFTATAAADALPWSSPRQIVRAPAPGEILVTSASLSPLVDHVLGLGLVRWDHDDTLHLVDPKEKFRQIEVVNRPFYDPSKSLPRQQWVHDHH